MTVHITLYWRSRLNFLNIYKFIKNFNDIDYGFNGFDTTFSVNLILFLTVVFILSFYSYEFFFKMKDLFGF